MSGRAGVDEREGAAVKISCDLSEAQREALKGMVEGWVSEGFTTPPYTDPEYDIFEWLGVEGEFYDTKRPGKTE